MLFSTLTFLCLFLPVVIGGFLVLGWLGWRRLALLWLGLASLVFYGWDDPARLLPLILASITFNYGIGWGLARWPQRGLLVLGVVGNLGLLGFYKYADFLCGTLNHVAGLALPLPGIALPIGISFFTFTQIAFLVDTWRGQAREYSPVHFLVFVTYFPHLIAGPILHHKNLIPQFDKAEVFRPSLSNLALGTSWFSLGLAKKLLLADPISRYVGPVFDAAGHGAPLSAADAWAGCISYTLQLYFDFSGYSDMAIGLSLLIGVTLPLNFDSPYRANSMIDFWRRWHMTLSQFLRDYLYIPLGGGRKGRARRYAHLIVTMLLGGLWHGAAWTFVLWGAIHGLALAINHFWRECGGRLPSLAARALTLLVVVLAWVPFRAAGLDETLRLWRAMAGGGGGLVIVDSAALWWIAGLGIIALFFPNTQTLLVSPRTGRWAIRWQPSWPWATGLGIALGAALAVMLSAAPSEFLYFRF